MPCSPLLSPRSLAVVGFDRVDSVLVVFIRVPSVKPYRNINGDSGITSYEYIEASIRIQFKSGKIYEYLESVIGLSHLTSMKLLADSGDGLNAYINNNPEIKNGCS